MDKFTIILRRIASTCLLLVSVFATANAQTWDETTDGGGDAGDLVSSAQGITVSGNLTTITGNLSNGDIDMYRIIITTGSAFSATTVGQADMDSMLGLLTETGMAVYFNDDDGSCSPCTESTLPAGDANSPSTDGDVYYLAVAGYDNHFQDADGNPIFTYNGTIGFTTIWGPDATYPGPVAQYAGNASGEMGTYTITLTSAEGDPTLPVELASFNAVLSGTDVLLRWKTLSEQQNRGFDVQVMSAGNTDFRSIGFVEGNGTTTEANEYEFKANDRNFGKQIFRLRQVDQDGNFRYSSEIEIAVELPSEFVMEPAYPNPFNPQSTFRFAVQDAQNVRVSLYNLVGQEVVTLYDNTVESNTLQNVAIDGGSLPSGIYIIRLAGENFETTQAISLLK